jgi:hypothetical protein
MADEPLVCPNCASTHPLSERFCPDCGMPLVHAGRTGADEPVTAAHERARKIKPQYSEGELPSMLRRSAGFDVPDMLAAGPRDVLVPASGAAAARDVLLQADLLHAERPGPAVANPARLLLGLIAAVALVGIVAWLGTEILT